MYSIESKILDAIRAAKRGKLIFPEDFNDLGSPEAIRLALHRLVKENIITRVVQGIYVRPVMSTIVAFKYIDVPHDERFLI